MCPAVAVLCSPGGLASEAVSDWERDPGSQSGDVVGLGHHRWLRSTEVTPGQPATPLFFSPFLPRRGDGLRREHRAS